MTVEWRFTPSYVPPLNDAVIYSKGADGKSVEFEPTDVLLDGDEVEGSSYSGGQLPPPELRDASIILANFGNEEDFTAAWYEFMDLMAKNSDASQRDATSQKIRDLQSQQQLLMAGSAVDVEAAEAGLEGAWKSFGGNLAGAVTSVVAAGHSMKTGLGAAEKGRNATRANNTEALSERTHQIETIKLEAKVARMESHPDEFLPKNLDKMETQAAADAIAAHETRITDGKQTLANMKRQRVDDKVSNATESTELEMDSKDLWGRQGLESALGKSADEVAKNVGTVLAAQDEAEAKRLEARSKVLQALATGFQAAAEFDGHVEQNFDEIKREALKSLEAVLDQNSSTGHKLIA